jgi:hypothetical protein
MSNLTHLAGDYWGVSVPKDASDFEMRYFNEIDKSVLSYGEDHFKPLDGQYSLIGVSDEMGEEYCREIVEHLTGLGYKNYEYTGRTIIHEYRLKTALESFHSLLKSKGLERVVVLKKK